MRGNDECVEAPPTRLPHEFSFGWAVFLMLFGTGAGFAYGAVRVLMGVGLPVAGQVLLAASSACLAGFCLWAALGCGRAAYRARPW